MDARRFKPGGHFHFMNPKLIALARDDARFSGATRRCLLALAEQATEQGTCWPSYDQLAALAKCDRRQAMRCLATLQAEGVIEIAGKTQSEKGQWVNLLR